MRLAVIERTLATHLLNDDNERVTLQRAPTHGVKKCSLSIPACHPALDYSASYVLLFFIFVCLFSHDL